MLTVKINTKLIDVHVITMAYLYILRSMLEPYNLPWLEKRSQQSKAGRRPSLAVAT